MIGTRYVEQNGLWVPNYTVGHGLGDWVARKLYKLGFKQTPGCSCPARQRWLNGRRRGSPPPISGGLTTDSQEDLCADSHVFFCENFDFYNIGVADVPNVGRGHYKAGPYDTTGYPGSQFITNAFAHDGTKSYECRRPAVSGAQTGCGWIDQNFPTGPVMNMYVRFWQRYQPNFIWPSETGAKTMQIYTGTTIPSTHFGHVSPSGYFEIGTQDREPTHPAPAAVLPQNVGAPIPVPQDGRWFCLEHHFKLNSGVGAGSTDGVVEGWINLNDGNGDQLKFNYPAIDIQPSGPQNGWQGFYVTGAGFGGVNSYPTQSFWIDQILFSTQRITCTGSAPPPPVVLPASAGGSFGFAGQSISGGR